MQTLIITLHVKPSKHKVHKIKLRISGTCIDTDDGKTDKDGDGCEYYDDWPGDCGSYDDLDFTATSVCCACGGGERGAHTLL